MPVGTDLPGTTWFWLRWCTTLSSRPPPCQMGTHAAVRGLPIGELLESPFGPRPHGCCTSRPQNPKASTAHGHLHRFRVHGHRGTSSTSRIILRHHLDCHRPAQDSAPRLSWQLQAACYRCVAYCACRVIKFRRSPVRPVIAVIKGSQKPGKSQASCRIRPAVASEVLLSHPVCGNTATSHRIRTYRKGRAVRGDWRRAT